MITLETKNFVFLTEDKEIQTSAKVKDFLVLYNTLEKGFINAWIRCLNEEGKEITNGLITTFKETDIPENVKTLTYLQEQMVNKLQSYNSELTFNIV